MSHHEPTVDEQRDFAIRSFRGVDVGLGQADPGAAIAAKIAEQHPTHLVLVQAGGFLHAYDRSAYALSTLKHYKLKLVGTGAEPHLRVGFPVGNFKRRLWPLIADFGIPYAVALGTQASGRTVHVADARDANARVLDAVSDQVVADVIADLQARGEINKAVTKQLLTAPETSGFRLKSQAQDLDLALLHDLLKMPRELRTTYGENLRTCCGRIVHGVMAYGLEENKLALLRLLSADVDVLKHYLSQAPRLSQLKAFNFEHRVGLAVELGRLVGGLLRAQQVQP